MYKQVHKNNVLFAIVEVHEPIQVQFYNAIDDSKHH